MKKPSHDPDIPLHSRGKAVLLIRRVGRKYIVGIHTFNDPLDTVSGLKQYIGGDPATEIRIAGLRAEIAIKLGEYVISSAVGLQRVIRAKLIKMLEGMRN